MTIQTIQITKAAIDYLVEEACLCESREYAEEVIQNLLTMCVILEPTIDGSDHTAPRP